MPKRTDILKGCTRWRITARWAAFAFVLFCSNPNVLACSDASNPTKISRNFTVEVFVRGKPVEGLQIELSTDPKSGVEQSRSVSIRRTDANGLARFRAVQSKLYFIAIKHPAFAYSLELRVMHHPPKGSKNIVSFEWPGWKPLATQTISGVLDGRARTNRPLMVDLTTKAVYRVVPGATLTLSKAVSNEVVSSQTTDESGKFGFKNPPPGLYFLRIETPVLNPPRWLYPHDGYVPIEVDPSAKDATVNLALDDAICGELAWGRPEGNDAIDAQTH
jgi:hypothetical protein